MPTHKEAWETVSFGVTEWNWGQNGNDQHWNVKFSSVALLCPTLCNPMDFSTPGLPVHHQLLEFTQTMCIESVMPSNHLILCHPILLPSIFPSIRVFSNESVLCIQWTPRTNLLKDGVVESPCNPRDSQESYPIPQFKSINSSAFSLLYGLALTSIHMTTGETIALTRWRFCWPSNVSDF